MLELILWIMAGLALFALLMLAVGAVRLLLAVIRRIRARDGRGFRW